MKEPEIKTACPSTSPKVSEPHGGVKSFETEERRLFVDTSLVHRVCESNVE
jgi:hypothetical protein